MNLREMQTACHQASYDAGWWHHPDSGLPYIPGDAHRLISANGEQSLQEWDMLPRFVRDLITHYWPFVVATKMALIHSEVSEALEALRRGTMDDKLHHRLGIETELSDSMIRQFDIGGAIERARVLGVVDIPAPFDYEAAISEKMAFNAVRPDHKVSARRAAGGKAF